MASKTENTIFNSSLGGTATVGFFLGVLSMYWLVRMKRTFRHDLIMMLIATDVVKAFAYMALPLAGWMGIAVDSKSTYCQFSGFIMVATVEATDYIMVVLAVQTALLVFRQYHDPGFGGLFEHRSIIYAGWIIIPCTMGSVAFSNPAGGYISIGAFCYLPPHPFVYRIVLSFVPRLFVFLSVLGIYSAIYIYTMRNLKEIREAERSVASTSPLCAGESEQTKMFDTQISSFSQNSELFAMSRQENKYQPFEMTSFSTDISFAEQGGHRSKPSIGTRIREMAIPVQQESISDVTTIVDSMTTTSGSSIYPQKAEQEQSSQNPTISSTEKKRLEIERQLRILFIYPAVYLLMWVYPILCQIFVWTSVFKSNHVPFEVRLFWGIFLAAQPGVDCLIFLWRERPWKRNLERNRERGRDFLRGWWRRARG